jgi:hypothetical protein
MSSDKVGHQVISMIVRVAEYLLELHVMEFCFNHLFHVIGINHAVVDLLIVSLVI